MGTADIEQYPQYLGAQLNVSANTQKTALNALVFLFRDFLQQEISQLSFQYAKKPRKLPNVFGHEEARAVLNELTGICRLAAGLMYGSGLGVMETARHRVQDVDFTNTTSRA